MKRIALTLAATILGTTAFAASEIDADGDGMVTLDEVQVVYPDITEESFAEMDTNSDGALDDAELLAAVDAGLLQAKS